MNSPAPTGASGAVGKLALWEDTEMSNTTYSDIYSSRVLEMKFILLHVVNIFFKYYGDENIVIKSDK